MSEKPHDAGAFNQELDSQSAMNMIERIETLELELSVCKSDKKIISGWLTESRIAVLYADRLLFTAPGLVYEGWQQTNKYAIKAAKEDQKAVESSYPGALKYRLVYNKTTKKIDKVHQFDGLVVESFDPPSDCNI